MSNDRFGGNKTFSYVVRVHKAGAIDLGEMRLPYFDPQTRSYQIARAALGIVQVKKADGHDVGPEVAEPLLPDLPKPRTALEGRHEQTFITERPVYWGALFGSPVACAFTIALTGALRRARERRAHRAPSPAQIAREKRAAAESALEGDDGKAAVAAVARALEAAVRASAGVDIRGTASDATLRELTDAGVALATAKDVVTILSECDSARFSPSGVSMDMARALWKRAQGAIFAAQSGEASTSNRTGGSE
jgi:hypothetical protein